MTNETQQTLISSLLVEGADKAIEMYKKAFGAKEESRMSTPDGKIMHACIGIGNSKLFIADVMPGMGCGTPSISSFYMYFDNVDDVFAQAKKAGLSEIYPVQDMFWGDRTGSIKDSFGIIWTIATHVRDVSPAELEKGRQEFMKKMAA